MRTNGYKLKEDDMKKGKTTTLNITISLEDKKKVEALREKHAINISKLVQNTIHETYEKMEKINENPK